MRRWVPITLLVVVGLCGLWISGGVFAFLTFYIGHLEYHATTGAWGWSEGMLVGWAAIQVSIATLVMGGIVAWTLRYAHRNPTGLPKWYFVILTILSVPLGFGFYISIFGWGVFPHP